MRQNQQSQFMATLCQSLCNHITTTILKTSERKGVALILLRWGLIASIANMGESTYSLSVQSRILSIRLVFAARSQSQSHCFHMYWHTRSALSKTPDKTMEWEITTNKCRELCSYKWWIDFHAVHASMYRRLESFVIQWLSCCDSPFCCCPSNLAFSFRNGASTWGT